MKVLDSILWELDACTCFVKEQFKSKRNKYRVIMGFTYAKL